MRRTGGWLVALITVAVALAGCEGDGAAQPAASTATPTTSASTAIAPPPSATSSASGATPTPSDDRFSGCVFIDGDAQEVAALTGRDVDLGLPVDTPVEVSPSGAESTIADSVANGCELVVAMGGRLEPAVESLAARTPAAAFVLVDAGARSELTATPTRDPAPTPNPTAATPASAPGASNVRLIDVRLDQATFLAGFMAAIVSTTRTVAVVLPTDPSPALAALAAAFRAGTSYRDGLVGHGTEVVESAGPPADVVLGLDGRPVAALAGPGVRVIAADGDGCARTPETCPSVLTGLVADVGPALREAATAATLGRFTGGTVPVSVATGGIRLAPVPDATPLPTSDVVQVGAAALAVSRGEVRVSPRDLTG